MSSPLGKVKKKYSINRPQRNHNEWLNLSYLSMQHWKCSMAMSGRVTAGSCLFRPFWTCNYKHWHKFMKMSIRSIILIVFSWNIFEFMKPTGFFFIERKRSNHYQHKLNVFILNWCTFVTTSMWENLLIWVVQC